MNFAKSSLGLALLFLALTGCASIGARRPWSLPKDTYAEVATAGTSAQRVGALLGPAQTVLFVDVDRERHTYTFDSIEGQPAPESDGKASMGIEVVIDYRDGVVQAADQRPTKLVWAPVGQRTREVAAVVEDRDAWRAKLVRQIRGDSELQRGTGAWAIPGPGLGACLLVRDGEEIYAEPILTFPVLGPDAFRSVARKSNPGERKWFLSCASGRSLKGYDVELAFDPTFQAVQVTWHRPFKSSGNGLAWDILRKFGDDISSEPEVYSGRALEWSQLPELANSITSPPAGTVAESAAASSASAPTP